MRRRQITDPAQLLDLPWLQQIGTSEAADWLERQGVAGTLRGGMVHMPGDMVLQAARAGQGVVVTTDSSVGRDIASGRLRLLFEDSDELGYHIVTRPGPVRPVARTFIAWLRRQAAEG
ncbi:MAG: LysR substrate-binding domain-containing protein [Jhaorihella sp.]